MATTKPEKKTEYGYGTSGTNDLIEQFATTLEDYTPDVAKEMQQSVKDGIQSENPQAGAVDMDYGDAPHIEKFWPNRGWPAGGVTDPSQITPGPDAHSSGWGSKTSPDETSAKVAKQKIGELIFGRSS